MERSIVVKLGGATIDQDGVIEELGPTCGTCRRSSPIIVHGGGSEIGRYLELLGKEFTFVKGLRVTDGDMVEIVEMVLSGKVNKELVSRFQHSGVNALGVSGKDMGLLRAERYRKDGVDIGFVGEIVEVNTALFDLCASNHVTPICLAHIGGRQRGNLQRQRGPRRAGHCPGSGLRRRHFHFGRGGHLPFRRPGPSKTYP